jgi:hypothetical protein
MVPQFAIYQPMRLVRRVGPLVQGICLDRDSSNAAYLPTLHVHCLCREFSVVSLNLGQPLVSVRSGTAERLSVQFHAQKYREACERLVASSLLPVTGDWTMSQVLAAFEAYRNLNRPDSRFPISLMEDAVSLWTWLGQNDRAQDLADQYGAEAKSWPEIVLVRQGGWDAWRNSLHTIAFSTDSLRKRVTEQTEYLKLLEAPVAELLS